MYTNYNDLLYREYGFKDAYHLTYNLGNENSKGWFDPDYLGIDQGAILIQLENYHSELIWKLMKKNPYIINGLHKAGFTGGWLD